MADAALVRLSLAEAADRIRRRALSPVALAEAVLGSGRGNRSDPCG